MPKIWYFWTRKVLFEARLTLNRNATSPWFMPPKYLSNPETGWEVSGSTSIASSPTFLQYLFMTFKYFWWKTRWSKMAKRFAFKAFDTLLIYLWSYVLKLWLLSNIWTLTCANWSPCLGFWVEEALGCQSVKKSILLRVMMHFDYPYFHVF